MINQTKRVYGQPVRIRLVERLLNRTCRGCKQRGLHQLHAGFPPNIFYATGGPKKLMCSVANIAWEQRVRGELVCIQTAD